MIVDESVVKFACSKRNGYFVFVGFVVTLFFLVAENGFLA